MILDQQTTFSDKQAAGTSIGSTVSANTLDTRQCGDDIGRGDVFSANLKGSGHAVRRVPACAGLQHREQRGNAPRRKHDIFVLTSQRCGLIVQIGGELLLLPFSRRCVVTMICPAAIVLDVDAAVLLEPFRKRKARG